MRELFSRSGELVATLMAPRSPYFSRPLRLGPHADLPGDAFDR